MMALFLLSMGLASAEEPAEEASVLVAGRAIVAIVADDEGSEALVGAGVSIEKALGKGFAAEVTVGELVGRDVVEVPVELVFTKNWPVGRHLEPFVGVGPALVMRSDLETDESELRWGGVAVAGTHVWLSPRWGLLFEADAVGTWRDGGAFGAEAVTGVVARW